MRTLSSLRRSGRATFAAVTLLLPLVLAGCGRHATRATAPLGESSAQTAGPASVLDGTPLSQLLQPQPRHDGFYPLAVGNAWDYDQHIRIVTTPNEGDPTSVEGHHALRAEIVRTVRIGSRDYYLQHEFAPAFEFRDPGNVFAMRQDASGLYNSDLLPVFPATPEAGTAAQANRVGRALVSSMGAALGTSPHRAAYERAAERLAQRLDALRRDAMLVIRPPGGAEPGEITMLEYPLRADAAWIVRDSPRFERVVIGRERLRLPVGDVIAWRLRGLSELYDEREQVFFWYNNLGLVRVLIEGEYNATDDTGNIIGIVSGTWDQRLVQFSSGFGGLNPQAANN